MIKNTILKDYDILIINSKKEYKLKNLKLDIQKQEQIAIKTNKLGSFIFLLLFY